jgi:hypothetical protein
MPGFKMHLSIAALFWVLPLMMYLNADQRPPIMDFIFYSGVFFVATLLPDLDHPISKIRRWFSIAVLTASILLMLYGYYTNNWWYILPSLGGISIILFLWFTTHRGLLHSFILTTILSFVLALNSIWLGAMFGSGYALHIFLDMVMEN